MDSNGILPLIFERLFCFKGELLTVHYKTVNAKGITKEWEQEHKNMDTFNHALKHFKALFANKRFFKSILITCDGKTLYEF